MQGITIAEGDFCVGGTVWFILSHQPCKTKCPVIRFCDAATHFSAFILYTAITPVLWDLRISRARKLQENQSRKQEASRWANTLIAFSSLGVMSRAWWGEEGLNAVLKHLISTSCNNSLRQLAWKVVTGMPSQLWKLACFTTNPVSGAQTVAEYHSHKHLLRGTGGLKGFINAAEAEVGNCWMFILEQPSGMYQPSFSGVAKEDGKGRGKALISRKDIPSWRILSLRVAHYLTGKNTLWNTTLTH